MQIAAKCDVHQVEATSGRSALHKAAFWGHNKMVEYPMWLLVIYDVAFVV